MSGIRSLSIRDTVALVVIAARTMAQYHATSADALVGEAFEVADAFVSASEALWADGARANHAQKAGQTPPPKREDR